LCKKQNLLQTIIVNKAYISKLTIVAYKD